MYLLFCPLDLERVLVMPVYCVPLIFISANPVMNLVVVSPLTFLIKDQVDSLTNHKILAGYVDDDSSSVIKENVNGGMYSVLFI